MILFIFLFINSCTYPYELRKDIISPTYDEWSEGYGETSAEIIMMQLDDWDEKISCHNDRKDCFGWWVVDQGNTPIPCVNPDHIYTLSKKK